VQLYLGGMPLDPAAHQLRAVHRMPVHDQVHPAWRTERPAALLTVVVAGAPSPKLRLLLDGLAAGQPLSFYSTP
jgi:hypothetical protein